jgi:hypothetical protein
MAYDYVVNSSRWWGSSASSATDSPHSSSCDWYPDQLVEDDGESWSLHIHGEHCLFTSLKSGTEVEVHTDCPDAIDPGFLLSYAESADRYPEIRTACLEGFHDMSRLLELAAIPLNPMGM